MEFKQYIGLGDSISTDDYPGKGLGGISLFYRNNDRLYPEYSRKDLVSKCGSITLTSLAKDASTSRRILEEQLPNIPERNLPTLVTITAGGNDILWNISDKEFDNNLTKILSHLKSKYNDLVILLGTIYDPSDWVGRFVRDDIKRIYQLNRKIRNKSEDNKVVIADIHKHFLGHGLPFYWIPENYWYCGLIEPNIKGGNEVRKVFLETFERWRKSKG